MVANLPFVQATVLLAVLHVCGAYSITGKGASLPKILYQRSLFAYSFVEPKVSIQYVGTGSGTGKSALIAGETEFGGSDSLFKESQYKDVPDLQMYPTCAAAVVPIYNVPSISHLSSPLVLGRETLAQIYVGNITHWNDPAILRDNPGLLAQGAVFPARAINVIVRSGKSGTTEIYKKALASFSTDFAAVGDTSSQPTWPIAGVSRVSSSLLGAAVAVTPHSLGYSVLSAALASDLRRVSIINRAGRVVAASSRSVSFALSELGRQLDQRFNAPLVDASSSGAWPIAGYTYLILRRNTTISDCATRRAALKFWEWFYTDAASSTLATQLGFATPPAVISRQVLAHMRQHTLCGSPPQRVFPATSTRVRGSGAASVAPLLRTLAIAYHASHTGTDITYTPDSDGSDGGGGGGSAGAPSSEFAVIRDGDVKEERRAAAAAGGLSTFPLGVLAVEVAYHADSVTPPASGASAAAPPPPPPLVLDIPLVADILSGRVSSWDHPRLVALNPGLPSPLPSAPIRVVTVAADTAANLVFTTALARLLPSSSSSSAALPVSASSDGWSPSHPLRVGTEHEAVAAVQYVPFTLAIVTRIGAQSTKLPAASLRVPTPAGGVTAGSDGFTLLSPNLDSLGRCLTSSTGTGGEAHPWLGNAVSVATAASARCWPFASLLRLRFPTSYTSGADSGSGSGSRSGSSGCAVGRHTHLFIRWLYQPGQMAQLFRGMGVAPLSRPFQRAILTEQQTFTCDGAQLLVKPACGRDAFVSNVTTCDLSTLQRQSVSRYLVADALDRECTGPLPSVVAFACEGVLWGSPAALLFTALSFTLAVICVALVLFVTWFRIHPVIAFSQPRFCQLFLLGAALTALSALSFLGENTDASCTLRTWALPLSFTVMFSNLLLKVHRAYRLLNNPALRSVTIKARVLYARLAALLMLDLLLLTLRQLLSPPAARTQQLSLGAYAAHAEAAFETVCVADSSGMLAVLLGVKAILVVAGTWLSVKAWGLQSAMAESKHLAVAIYNLTFIAAICLLLLQGFALPAPSAAQLLCGGVLWTVLVSVAVLFAPKVHAVLCGPAHQHLTSQSRAHNRASLTGGHTTGGPASQLGPLSGHSSRQHSRHRNSRTSGGTSRTSNAWGGQSARPQQRSRRNTSNRSLASSQRGGGGGGGILSPQPGDYHSMAPIGFVPATNEPVHGEPTTAVTTTAATAAPTAVTLVTTAEAALNVEP